MPFHAHHFIKGAGLDSTPLLMLHGSGGTEQDMVPLASQFAPTSTAVAVRGARPWERGFAFFRRFEDRSIDEGDLVARAAQLADEVAQIGMDFHFPRPPIAVGFSNGAIMRPHWSCCILAISPVRFFSGRYRHSSLIRTRTSRALRRSSSMVTTTSGDCPAMAPAWQNGSRAWAQT